MVESAKKTNTPEKIGTSHMREGFALIAAIIIVAALSMLAIPLITVVQQNQKQTIQQRVAAQLSREAREGLEIGVYLTKLANGVPPYFTSALNSEAKNLAKACDTRLSVADAALLRADNLTLFDNSSASPLTRRGNQIAAVFIVDKGAVSDSRFQRFLVASCALSKNIALSVVVSELAKTEGSFYTLSLREY